MENKDLIGRKVRGFKFEDKKHNGLAYNQAMDNYIGKIGKIIIPKEEPKQETLEKVTMNKELNEIEFYKYLAKQDSFKSVGLFI